MSTVYTVRVNDREYIVTMDKDDNLFVNNEPLVVEYIPVAEGMLLRFNNRSFTAHIERIPKEGTAYLVNINGKSIPLDLEDEKAALMRSLESDKATKLHSALVRSPMPGKITKVLVSEGELIEAGQGVLILEAMKMENEIKSPAAGIVKGIRVKDSDTVEKNTILIEIS